MSSWGVTGANKPRSHNVNSVYAGRNNASGRAAGSVKNGLQVLGKSTSIVRRMPPPATLPSLKSEIGHDSSIILVPQGGQGWNKPVDTSDSKNLENQANSPDLRPNWAKGAANGHVAPVEPTKPSPVHSQRTNKVTGTSATNSREFPPLAAAVATTAKPTSTPPTGSAAASNDSPKSSKLLSSKVEEPKENIVNIPPPPSTGSGYIGASTGPRSNVDRKIPDRYIGAPEGSRPSNQLNKHYDFRQKLAQLSMDSKERSEERQAAQKAAEPAESKQPAAAPRPVEQPVYEQQAQQAQGQAGRSQDVRSLYTQPSAQEAGPPDVQQPVESGWGRPMQDEYNRPRPEYYPPQQVMPGHGDAGYQRHYDDSNWDDMRWSAPTEQRRQRPPSFRGEEEWYNRNDGKGGHGGEYGGKYDNGYQGRNRPSSNSYSDDFDPYAMYGGNERRSKRRSENGDDGQNRQYPRDNREYDNEVQKGQPGRNAQQPQVYRMLKRNDEKSAEYFSTRSNLGSMTEEESAETLSQMTRFGRPSKQHQNDEAMNRFNKAPGSGKPQIQKEKKEPRPQAPPENVWKKRMEEQSQQQQVQKKQEEKHTWGEAKQTRKFDYHFPVMEKEQLNGWDDVNEGNGYHEEHERKEYRNRRPPKAQAAAPVQRSWNNAPEQSRKAVSGRPKKRNEPEDNFSNMGEFHAEDYKIDDVVPPKPSQNNFEEGFAAVDMEKKHRRTPNDDVNRPLKPQRGAPHNRSWRDNKPRRTPEETSDNGDKRKSGWNRNQNQRGPRREYNNRGPKNEEEEIDETHSNGSGARYFENSTGSRKSGQRPVRPRPRQQVQPKNSNASEQQTKPQPTNQQQQSRPQNQKNAKPASPTSQNNGAFVKSNDENNSPALSKNAKMNAREKRPIAKECTRNGLAGVDLNNASVFVIDNQPEQPVDVQSESGEFEEVLSRKAKKQRQEQQRQEEERVTKERQRHERQEQQKKNKQKDEKNRKQNRRVEERRKRQDSEVKSLNDSLSPVSATDSGCVAVSSTSHVSGESGADVSNATLPNRSVWNDTGVIPQTHGNHTQEDYRQNIPAPIARPTSKAKDNVALELSRESESIIYASHAVQDPDFDFGAGQMSPKSSFINENHVELQKKVSKVKDIWPGDEGSYRNGLQPVDSHQGNGSLDVQDPEDIQIGDARQLNESHLNNPGFLHQTNGFANNYILPNSTQVFGHLANSSPTMGQNFLAAQNFVDPGYFAPAQTDWSSIEMMNGIASPTPIQYFNGNQMPAAQRFAPQPATNNFRQGNRLVPTTQPPAMNPNVPPPNMTKHHMPSMVPFNNQVTHHVQMGPFVPPVSQVDFSVPPPNVGVVGGHRQQMTCNQNPVPRHGIFNGTSMPSNFRNGQRRSSHNSGGLNSNPSPGLQAHLTWNPPMNGANTFGLF
ncbi:unnamed protein product [Bursaphelenchus okinawaensis]|uniref:BAT2 N-terminal domain-containing protein n=1 Tax=Bursaphelenchus okinawaensis TaxID=465554 RepID=A0A811LQY6_9BILA|nr:unnamed protein product [Bursaphelenchus okinawaensis]CAG9126964.1 unnamed protein product [Bursaphelenchus okinawaensis]